jgi:hypothetical protein
MCKIPNTETEKVLRDIDLDVDIYEVENIEALYQELDI